jgi:CDP-glycerol glycerophosphotransferase
MRRDTVVFSSWHGRFSDSPRALAAELARRGMPLQHVWIADESTRLPNGVERVAPGSEAERAALESARWIVSNDVLPLDFRKRPDATFLQTWHGTPLKRIGYDVENPTFPDAEYHYSIELGRDVARWDVLLSPNAVSTEVLRRAFRFGGPILETGYPRNDALFAPDHEVVRARAREALGIADGARVVLYAPTWRDSFEMKLELRLQAVAAALPGTVLLVRAHGLTAARSHVEGGDGVVDVTRWPDIAELYLAADVLLTDYSSAMVDFANTGKPMLLYTYDLERYRDEMRGFYNDFEAEAPAPLLRTTEEVVEALSNLDAVTDAYGDRYAAFHQRYCHLDDGGAAARVVDAVFGQRASEYPAAAAASPSTTDPAT